MGLPGSGKTTLALALKSRISASHINADVVRQTINSHLSYSLEDRIKQAITMKNLADNVVKAGKDCIVDFICPTKETREAFDWMDCFVVFVDRIDEGRFDDTNRLFERPEHYDFWVTENGRSPEYWAKFIEKKLVTLNSQDSV